jgi:DNA-binding NtrC family response regulator
MKTEKPTIFVVDDNTIALETIAGALKNKFTCEVELFTTAESCIYRLNESPPSLIISDYYLDSLYKYKMNGDQMLGRIKKQYPNIPVIMYSAQNSVDVVMRLMKLGAVDFIPKERNFIRSIMEITLQQINKLKHDYELRWLVRLILFIFGSFIISLMVIFFYLPAALPYFIIGGPALMYITALIWNRVNHEQA